MSWAESDTRAIKCLPAAIATINAGLIDVEEVEVLLLKLEWLSEHWICTSDQGLRPIGELSYSSLCAAPAIAFAIAHSNDPTLESWLAALLRTPLAENMTFGRPSFFSRGVAVKYLGHESWPINTNSANLNPSWTRTVECVKAMPAEFWSRLAGHPNKMLQNLHQLTIPEFATRSPSTGQIYRKTLRWLNNCTNEEALLLACHPETSDFALKRIAHRTRLADEVRVCAARNRNATPELLESLSRNRLAYFREAVASHPNTTHEVLVRLAGDRHYLVVLAALAHPRATEAMIRRVLSRVHRSYPDPIDQTIFLVHIACTITSAPKVLMELSKHRHRHVRKSVVNNPSFPASQLKRMAADRSLEVRQAVAWRPKVSRNILSTLAKDPKWQVREAVASNSGTLRRDLDRLSSDTNRSVRRAVAGNERTPKDTLAKLSRESNYFIDVAVASNRSTSLRVLRSLLKSPNRISTVASNPAASATLLTEIACTATYPHIRMHVARNPSTPPDVLRRLARRP